jgi:hypothetical protein
MGWKNRFALAVTTLLVLTACNTPPISTAPPPATNPPPTNTDLPPASATLSRAYKEVIDKHYASFPPKEGECSKEIHARFWVYGPDNKVYPTWHPPIDPATGCRFGHEHGHDPAGSDLAGESLAFGYVNEQLSPDDPQFRRDEDHVGHKIEWVNNAVATAKNATTAIDALPAIGAQVSATCSLLIKVHQGTHSPDAFSNNLHELFYYIKCSDGSTLMWQGLTGFGSPGTIRSSCRYDLGEAEDLQVNQAIMPPNSPDDAGIRRMPDDACTRLLLVPSGQNTPYHYLGENWEMAHKVQTDNGGLYLRIAPYFDVHNPARYYDPASSNNLVRTLDLCYVAGENRMRGGVCDAVRAISEKITYNDTRSPFNGADRVFQLQEVTLRNTTGKTVWYVDAVGKYVQDTPDPARGVVIKITSTPSNDARMAGGVQWEFDQDIAGNYGAPETHVHAPN